MLSGLESELAAYIKLPKRSHSVAIPIVENNILKHWDVEGSLVLLIGRAKWDDLEPGNQNKLKKAFETTLTRYFLEALAYYQGQPIRVSSVTLNEKKTRGWLRVLVEIDYLPSFPIDLKVVNKEQKWLLQDIRVQGIRYSKMKRNWYSEQLKVSINHLIAELENKNNSFFKTTKKVD
nr:ABC transporter substrate-binding protein [Pleionea sp. CnH1-48]